MMIEKVMIQSGAKSLKNSGGVGGGGSLPHDDRTIRANNLKSSSRMMIAKVMIQLGAKSPKNSGGVGGLSPTMIEKVMIQ